MATVTVTGEVDTATAPALASRLREVAAEHPERLVLDLDGLFVTDVASARALDSAYQALDKQFRSSCERPGLPRPAGLRPHQADGPLGRAG